MPKPSPVTFPPLPASEAAAIRELLRDRKRRNADRAVALEGEKPIIELLRTRPAAVLSLVITPGYMERCDPEQRRRLEKASMPVYQAKVSQLDAVLDVRASQGILAVVRQPTWNESAMLSRHTLLGVYGECVQDPANVGALIRSALAFGVDALWLSPDSVDVWNPKVVRGTAGAVLSLPIFQNAEVEPLLEADCMLMAACLQEARSRDLKQITAWPPKAVIALGNESRGLSDRLKALAGLRFHIPISPAVESLNVATAAAIALYHFSGLRQQKG
jgi:TrmH family RNA methyltransferase